MRRSILFLSLIAAALAVSCSKKKDNKEAKQADTPPADKGTPGEVADETPPEAQPDKPSPPPFKPASPPFEPAVEVDCEPLLTTADVAKACGGKAADIEIRTIEGGDNATTCLRLFGPKGAPEKLFSLHVNVDAARSPDEAKATLEGSAKLEGTKKLDIADGAYFNIVSVPETGTALHVAEAVKGVLWFKVGYVVGLGEKKPPCTDKGVVKLVKLVAGRLP